MLRWGSHSLPSLAGLISSSQNHKQKKSLGYFVRVWGVFSVILLFWVFLASVSLLHAAPSLYANGSNHKIASCLLLTVNSPCFGSGCDLIHNWKWLLRSIGYASVLLTSATQAPPGGCSWGIFFSLLHVIFPLCLFLFLSYDAFSWWQFTLQLRLL